MTLNLLFITVTFKKKQETFDEATHFENVSQRFEETKSKQYTKMSQIF
ncbi:YrzI family small protein [Rossellomorea aquimaris]|nr:YrzI family small protein [Rossellomorea aquimaris]